MYKDIVRKDRTLRSYQQTAKEEIFAAWDGFDNILFQMPTGTGKTRLFTSIISDIKAWGIIRNKDIKILIVAHRVELIEQISDSLNKYKVSHGIIAGGKDRNLLPQVQVASIQTITHRTNIDVARSLNVDFIIIDEAHHSLANSYKKIWSLYPSSKKLGVTATPWRMNHTGFTSLYDKLILSKTIKEFIEDGWLAPYCYYSINSGSKINREIMGIDEFDIEGDYKSAALERVMDNSSIRAQLLNSYLRLAKGKKGIIYSISRKHSDHICEEYRNAGIKIVRIDSETPRNERCLYVQRFKNGQIDIIVNVDIFSEGFDCPDIEFIQLARPTKSLVKYLQQVGRGLRPVAGKGKCIILDNVGSHIEFGLPDAERDWEVFFVGEPQAKKQIKPNSIHISSLKKEVSFKEGTDEMTLIEDVIVKNDFSNIDDSWSDEDNKLLKTLIIDRHCSIEIVASVFRKDIESIKKHLRNIGVCQDVDD